jgi:two-component system, OmpR family, manganese sensing sensor histidine kinase
VNPSLRAYSRNPLSQTRLRLVVSYVAVTAAIVLLFAGGFYSYVRWTLIERVDDTLKHVTQVVERSLVVKMGANHRLSIDLDRAFASGQDDPAIERDLIYLEWFDAFTKPIKSTALFRHPVPLERGYIHATVEVAPGHKLRQFTVPIRYQGQLVGYLRASHQWFEVDKPSQHLAVDLFVGALVTLLLIGSAGWVLSEIALRPVRRAYDHLQQFTADASHELRTPIAAIQANAQLSLENPDGAVDDYRQSLEAIERVTRRMGKLVADLLFLARNEGRVTEAVESCNLVDILNLVVEEHRPLANAAEVNLQFAPLSGAVVQGVPDQMHRLFTNLLSNAIRYTPAGGQIHLTVSQSSSKFTVEVRDTGIGIEKKHLTRIFERFYRSDKARSRAQGGTGLGLAIAKAIIDNHRGEIQVESTVGEGTIFRVKLPKLAEKTVADAVGMPWPNKA